jgi:heptosyltransferase-1
MNVLIVRLSALGDIVHTIPAAAAIRKAYPEARIDWVVDARHRELVDLVGGIDRVVALESASVAGWVDAVRRLRQVRYDVALDLQGLMKSAVLARASGARRVVGFSIWHLREKAARPFYSETDGHTAPARSPGHVIFKNLRLLRTIGIDDQTVAFPLACPESAALDRVRADIGTAAPFALLNPGAAWSNKRWPPGKFADIAAFLRDVRGLHSLVLWGPAEHALARQVVEASGRAARLAPPTTIAELLSLAQAASLIVSGDTGPLHIAAAAGTPIVALFGPTDPLRNGPWSADDVVVSRYQACTCQYERRCRRPASCLAELSVAEVTAAIQQRLQTQERRQGQGTLDGGRPPDGRESNA